MGKVGALFAAMGEVWQRCAPTGAPMLEGVLKIKEVPPPHQDWGRARTAGNRFARDGKELGPQLGEKNTRRAAS
jgi:hypothetical protein